ncbi:MAG: alpha/beta fold hydrolase [Roseburia sp.]|nr:alpha/beta fold hydrolase [Roseburia sp.]
MKKSVLFMLCILTLVSSSLGGCARNGDDSILPEESSASGAVEEETEIASVPETENMQVSEALTYEYETQELYAQRDGNQIYGLLYIPQGAGEKMPAVIFSHGFGGNHQVGAQYAKALAQKGYVVYCFDFCGGSPGSRSDGSTLEMSVFTEQADLEAVIRMMQEQAFVDKDNIFLMGTSMGGAVSAITAAAHEEEIQGAILLYPAFVMVDDVKERFESAEDIPDSFYHMWMTVGRVFAEDLLDYDIYGAISAYKKDVLLIHGDADGIVPLSCSEKAVEAYDSARLEVLPGAGHGFSGEDARQATDWILEYLNTHRK